MSSNLQVVASLDLPAGDYIVWSRANILELDTKGGQIICSLGDDAAQNVNVDKGQLVAISQTTPLTLASPGQIKLLCLRQNAPMLPNPLMSVQQRSLTAIKVSSITGP